MYCICNLCIYLKIYIFVYIMLYIYICLRWVYVMCVCVYLFLCINVVLCYRILRICFCRNYVKFRNMERKEY